MRRKDDKPASTPALDRYRARIADYQMAPLWERLRSLLTPEPQVASRPQRWHYDGLRSLLLESAELISAEEAERRVLILENPGLSGSSAITESLFAGLQLVMPGEIAPSHRHSPAALRFILEGDGAYTAVNGEKLAMHPGDVILTPSWHWHDHGHEGQGPFVWLDVLDLPIVRSTTAIFFEEYPELRFPEHGAERDSYYRFGANLRPANYVQRDLASPLLIHPYERTRDALLHLKQHSTHDPHHGIKMELVDPTRGCPALPTISTFMQYLPAGFVTHPYRSTDGTIFCVIEGHGEIRVGSDESSSVLEYAPRDILVVPGWQRFQIESREESIFFSASDRVVQQKLGIWRERRESDAD